MADKTVIYIQQGSEPCTPVTVRVEWLSDGTIKPCFYWTPDGSCYKVQFIYEMTRLAHLKDRGEGIRFRVRATLKEAPEPYCDNKFALHETYLYLADKFFCGRNIIDERYAHDSKEFIPVILDVFPNCQYELVCFKARGVRYIVERTIKIEPRSSLNAGGFGIWHKVEARQWHNDEPPRMAALYFEINKWFVRSNRTHVKFLKHLTR